MAVLGVCLNRWVMVLQVLAAPVLTFENWTPYLPSWQEVATTLLPVALGIIMVAISYRYLPVFPQEPELNPIEPDVAKPLELEAQGADAPAKGQAESSAGQPEPAEA